MHVCNISTHTHTYTHARTRTAEASQANTPLWHQRGHHYDERILNGETGKQKMQCGVQQPGAYEDALVTSFVGSGGRVDVSGVCSRLRPC